MIDMVGYEPAEAEGTIGAPSPALVHIPTDLLTAAVPGRAWLCGENFRYNNVFDTAAARADLGFRQAIPFDDGVCRIVAWLDARDRIDDSDDDPVDDRATAA